MALDGKEDRELNLLLKAPGRRFGRRGFLQVAGLLGAAGVAGYAGGTIAGLTQDDDGGAAPAPAAGSVPGNRRSERVLNIYNWNDYIDDRTIPVFQARFNMRVNYDVYSPNEDLLAKLRAGPTQYDIVVPTNNFIPTYRRLRLIEPLRQDLIPNLTNLGKSPNSSRDADLAEVVRLVRSIKRRLKRFTTDTYIDELAAGETWLAQGWSGDVFQAQDANADVAYVIPKEGSMRFVDVMCVPKGAPHAANAARFINYVLRPTTQARISKYVSYATPVSLAKPLLPADQLSDPAIYPPASTKLSIVTITGQKLEKWQAAYDQIIAR